MLITDTITCDKEHFYILRFTLATITAQYFSYNLFRSSSVWDGIKIDLSTKTGLQSILFVQYAPRWWKILFKHPVNIASANNVSTGGYVEATEYAQ
jgi:hypothetical protein